MTRLSIDIPDELHHYLKIYTARKQAATSKLKIRNYEI